MHWMMTGADAVNGDYHNEWHKVNQRNGKLKWMITDIWHKADKLNGKLIY